MGTVMMQKTALTGHISTEHSNRLYWLGRYAERAFTTLRSLERLHDKVIDRDAAHYQRYLDCFGRRDTYGDYKAFFRSFLFDRENTCSIAYSLERAYDNGIELREEISTEAFAYLQLALDQLERAEPASQGLVVSLMPLEDTLYSFFGCFLDHVYNEEIRDIFLCGKTVERLEMLIRLKYRQEKITPEFERLCACLDRIPENTPYRYNAERLEALGELIAQGCAGHEQAALSDISRLFEGRGV